MKKFYAACVSLAAAFFVLNGFITQASNQDRFWNDAAQMGLAEVALSNLALQKSQNEQVRSFAQRMVDDHTAVNSELTQLAGTKNVTLPTTPDQKHQSAMEKLNGQSGAEFDRNYMRQMVKDHEAAVKLFQRQSERGEDADAKAFAAKHLPALQSHLQMARTMSDGLKGSSRGGDNDSGGGNTNSGNRNGGDMDNMNSNSGGNTNANRNTNRGNTNSGNTNRDNSNGGTTNRNTNRNTNTNTNNTNGNTNGNSNNSSF